MPDRHITTRRLGREIPQFGLTPQTASKYGIPYSAQNSPAAQASAEAAVKLVEEAKLLEAAGACLLDFTNSGPIAGAAVAAAVQIPVIGGFGGGPWLDGRVRLAHTAIGYGEKMARCDYGDLRQYRKSGACRICRADRRCPWRTADQGLTKQPLTGAGMSAFRHNLTMI